MARGKGKAPAKQSSLRAAGLLPTLKKPAEAIGLVVHTPGEFWEGCAAADRKKLFKCNVRLFEAVHKWPGSRPPGAAFEVQEMGELGTGSLEPGVASGEVLATRRRSLSTSMRPIRTSCAWRHAQAAASGSGHRHWVWLYESCMNP